jgi:hypothetical protein
VRLFLPFVPHFTHRSQGFALIPFNVEIDDEEHPDLVVQDSYPDHKGEYVVLQRTAVQKYLFIQPDVKVSITGTGITIGGVGVKESWGRFLTSYQLAPHRGPCVSCQVSSSFLKFLPLGLPILLHLPLLHSRILPFLAPNPFTPLRTTHTR